MKPSEGADKNILADIFDLGVALESLSHAGHDKPRQLRKVLDDEARSNLYRSRSCPAHLVRFTGDIISSIQNNPLEGNSNMPLAHLLKPDEIPSISLIRSGGTSQTLLPVNHRDTEASIQITPKKNQQLMSQIPFGARYLVGGFVDFIPTPQLGRFCAS